MLSIYLHTRHLPKVLFLAQNLIFLPVWSISSGALQTSLKLSGGRSCLCRLGIACTTKGVWQQKWSSWGLEFWGSVHPHLFPRVIARTSINYQSRRANYKTIWVLQGSSGPLIHDLCGINHLPVQKLPHKTQRECVTPKSPKSVFCSAGTMTYWRLFIVHPSECILIFILVIPSEKHCTAQWELCLALSPPAPFPCPLHPSPAQLEPCLDFQPPEIAGERSCNLKHLDLWSAIFKGSKDSVPEQDNAKTLAAVHTCCFYWWQSCSCPGGPPPPAFLPY